MYRKLGGKGWSVQIFNIPISRKIDWSWIVKVVKYQMHLGGNRELLKFLEQ